MLCYEFPPLGGGGGQSAVGLSAELARQGHDVDLVTMGYRRLPRRDAVKGVQVHRIPCLRKKRFHCTVPEAASYLAACPFTVRSLLRREPYDVVHAHFLLPDGFTAWWIRRSVGLPYVVTVHGSDVPGYNPDRLRLTHGFLRPLWKRLAHDADRIVCPSRTLRSLVRRQLPDLQVDVIPHGFDPARLSPDRQRRRRILMVTRLLKRKGVQDLLTALDGTGVEHELHIVGEGPYGATLREMADATRARVEFHGWLENTSAKLKRLYESSEIFVLPSRAENFPISLLEAMAAGLAIVTSKGTGCAEVVGDDAILVEPEDVSALRAALLALTSNPERCRQLGRRARTRLEDRFGWPVVAKRYVDLYRRFGRAPQIPRREPIS